MCKTSLCKLHVRINILTIVDLQSTSAAIYGDNNEKIF
jgi:hypothetical protein